MTNNSHHIGLFLSTDIRMSMRLDVCSKSQTLPPFPKMRRVYTTFFVTQCLLHIFVFDKSR